MSADTMPVPRVLSVGRIVVWVVAALLLAYVTWQAVGNFVGVSRTLQENNAFLAKNGADALQTSVPWPALVLDVLIAPIGFVVALVVSRRMPLGRTVVVFATALCAVSALWFTLLQYVTATLSVGS
ncbi:hypothetical protein Csp2054_04000 [Curtobacterium sp. 'Ferrero']|uniref:hypothetical protein n=1 Tax=Curtobacterium sp. 'Ferrero' TaxID=2033654 RepID=UPI000BDC087D|nr:hypothetical protein [Curtobacterium sp. 'Ferrero']PCN49345.1 hypothetical protein Csp2054_04000 [Curtobacterium sp. 'Ferrero']